MYDDAGSRELLWRRRSADLRFLYGQLLDDIRFRKGQQWLVSTSAIGVQVLIGGIGRKLCVLEQAPTCVPFVLLAGLAWIAAVAAIAIVWDFQGEIVGCRSRLLGIEAILPDELIPYFGGKNSPPNYLSPWYKAYISMFLTGFTLAGAMVVTWLLFASQGEVRGEAALL